MSDCVIDVGHPEGVLATWINADNPELVVCNHHKKQYETAHEEYNIKWLPILRDGSIKKHHPGRNCSRLCGGDQ